MDIHKFFDEQVITGSKLPKERQKYTYDDLIAFAKTYAIVVNKNCNLHDVMASYSDSDEIFRFKKLTTFEELLFAKRHIKELKADIAKLNTEKGILKSEKDELKYRLKSENPTADKLHKYKEQIKSTREKSKKYQRMYERVNSELIMLKNGVL